jgi:hypothetical protein
LTASLKYLPGGYVGEYNGVEDFLQMSTPVDVQLFFDQLNVPTRPFDQGFLTQDGSLLTLPDGTTLYEFFGLQFDTVIRLTANDQPGLYEFAVLTDDGSILSFDTGSGLQEYLNADGDHPTVMGCPSSALALDSTSAVPMHLDYYQGPRYNIALMLLWRRVADQSAASLDDPACGTDGNDLYFDQSTNPTTPTSYYFDLLGRGWSVVPAENFYLPNTSAPNPCASPSPSASPTPTPSPSPTPNPSPTPAPTQSPTPNPICSTGGCGGVIGI